MKFNPDAEKFSYTVWAEGLPTIVRVDGKDYSRIVRYRPECGLYITINGYMYFEYEFDYGDW